MRKADKLVGYEQRSQATVITVENERCQTISGCALGKPLSLNPRVSPWL